MNDNEMKNLFDNTVYRVTENADYKKKPPIDKNNRIWRLLTLLLVSLMCLGAFNGLQIFRDGLTTDTIDETTSGSGVTIETVLMKDKSIGATGDRVTKVWATDLEVTNAIAGSVTGNAGTVTTNANLTGQVTSVGNAASLDKTAITGQGDVSVLASDDTLLITDTSASGALGEITVRTLFDDIPTTDATTAYTLASTDITVYMTSGSANVVTVPLNATVPIGVNKTIAVVQSGAGATTITSVSGVTINGVDNESVVVSGQYGVVLLTKKATDDWFAQGIKITDPQFQTLTLSHTAPYITTENTTVENTDGGCESSWTANDHSSTALGNVTISHDCAADDTKGKIIIQTNNGTSLTDAVTIDSSQKVGIGTTSPSSYWANADDLVVSGAGARGISIISTDSNTCSLAFGDSTSTTEAYEGIIQYTHSSNSMAFWTGHNARMTIDSSGNVTFTGTAINMTTSGTTLTVGTGADNGTVSAGVFTDRTKYFDGDALTEIMKVKGKDGQLDHKTLPDFARVEMVRKVKDNEGNIEKDENGNDKTVTTDERDLGAMISILTKGIQEQQAIIEALKTRIEVLEAK